MKPCERLQAEAGLLEASTNRLHPVATAPSSAMEPRTVANTARPSFTACPGIAGENPFYMLGACVGNRGDAKSDRQIGFSWRPGVSPPTWPPRQRGACTKSASTLQSPATQPPVTMPRHAILSACALLLAVAAAANGRELSQVGGAVNLGWKSLRARHPLLQWLIAPAC